MTGTASDRAALAAIITRTRYLLLDFDGPVCSIFAGLPAPTVAEELRKLFTPDQLFTSPAAKGGRFIPCRLRVQLVPESRQDHGLIL
jgi:hypothetical protein